MVKPYLVALLLNLIPSLVGSCLIVYVEVSKMFKSQFHTMLFNIMCYLLYYTAIPNNNYNVKHILQ